MTELQLRLWCLWMCESEEVFDLIDHHEAWPLSADLDAALEGADTKMRALIVALLSFSDSTYEPPTPCQHIGLHDLWALSERMP